MPCTHPSCLAPRPAEVQAEFLDPLEWGAIPEPIKGSVCAQKRLQTAGQGPWLSPGAFLTPVRWGRTSGGTWGSDCHTPPVGRQRNCRQLQSVLGALTQPRVLASLRAMLRLSQQITDTGNELISWNTNTQAWGHGLRTGPNSQHNLTPLTPGSFSFPGEPEAHPIVPLFNDVNADLFACSHFTKFKKY